MGAAALWAGTTIVTKRLARTEDAATLTFWLLALAFSLLYLNHVTLVTHLLPMLAERGMHIQMLMNAHKHMAEITPDLPGLPCPVVFDHLGWPADGMTPDSPGFRALCALIADGQAYVKLSAPYRMCDAPYSEAAACTRALLAANPERCLWGSDWPHVMLNGAQMPQASAMLDALDALIPDESTRRRVFVDNPSALFGI